MRYFIIFILFSLGFALFFYFAYRFIKKVRDWSNKTWQDTTAYIKGYLMKVQQERKTARSIGELPTYMQQGMQQLSTAKKNVNDLPERWQLLLRPVVVKADEIGTIVLNNPKHGESVRRFFTVTLDAFEHFSAALLQDHQAMGRIEEEKAMQSIEIFRKDFLSYATKLDTKRRFDFQVLTDVIKHRLRK